MNNLGYYNGKIDVLDKLQMPVLDRSVYFGDGVYDVVHAVNRKAFALDEHIDRFYVGCEELEIKFNMSKSKLKTTIQDVIYKQGSKHQTIYWQVSRGTSLRDHAFPENCLANLLIIVTGKKMKDMDVEYDLILLEDTRFLHCNVKTLNLIPSVLAAQKAKEMGCHEAVLHRNRYITECSHSNIAILKEGVLKTAPANKLILAGITRSHIIRICKKLDIKVLEQAFTVDELMNCDEAIVCASGALCMRVKTVNGRTIGGKSGELFKKIQNVYKDMVIKECGSML